MMAKKTNSVENKKEIYSIIVYQAVQFEKSNHTYFSTSDVNGTPGRKIEINEDWGGVEISSNRDHILVPVTNISVINFKSPIRIENIKKSEDARAKNVGIKPHEISRPK